MRPVTFAIIRPVGRIFANNSILPIGNRKIAVRNWNKWDSMALSQNTWLQRSKNWFDKRLFKNPETSCSERANDLSLMRLDTPTIYQLSGYSNSRERHAL